MLLGRKQELQQIINFIESPDSGLLQVRGRRRNRVSRFLLLSVEPGPDFIKKASEAGVKVLTLSDLF